ncbi:MAG: SDR family oxidoreductase [Planctomycetota bacterium]|nr:SDR family oxidoreductase [Planctomycetota bacterium]MDA1114707.1 SDR family oxidoreductase [Planctomycetota bacterium]
MTSPRNILITGASTGIGRAIALDLASRGDQVIGTVRKQEDADALLAATPTGALPIRSLLLDVTDGASVLRAAEELEEQLQGAGLHGLINNAGVAITAPLEYIPIEDFQLQMEINLIGLLRTTQAFLPMVKKARGRVINISSIAGRLAFPLAGPYHSSKHALEGLSDVMRLEFRRYGIEVVVIQPGAIRTPIWGTAAKKSAEIGKKLSRQALKDYGKLIQQVGKASAQAGENGEDPQLCADAVRTALDATRPRTRYIVGRNAKIGMFLRRILSDRRMDKIVGKGLDLKDRTL